jgi:hypothetical protein
MELQKCLDRLTAKYTRCAILVVKVLLIQCTVLSVVDAQVCLVGFLEFSHSAQRPNGRPRYGTDQCSNYDRLASDAPGLPLQCQHTPICSRLHFGAQRPCAPDFQSCDSNSVQLCDDWQEVMPNGQFHPWAPIPSSGYSLS